MQQWVVPCLSVSSQRSLLKNQKNTSLKIPGKNEQRVIDFLQGSAHWPDAVRKPIAWLLGAVVCPFVDFFARNGVAAALIILTFISVFRMSDIAMGVMSGPFYADMQYTEHQIAWASKTFGLVVNHCWRFVRRCFSDALWRYALC